MPTFLRICARLLVAIIVMGASGCAPGMVSGRDTMATWQVPGRTAQLLRSPRDGTIAVEVQGANTRIPLPGYSDARVEGVVDSSGNRVAVIKGGSTQCPVDYTLVAINATSFATARIGDCYSEYKFENDGHIIMAVQQGVADPLLWTLEGARLDGPVHKSALSRVNSPQSRRQQTSGNGRPTTNRQQPQYQQAVLPNVVESRTPSRAGDEVIPRAVTPGSAAPRELPILRLVD